MSIFDPILSPIQPYLFAIKLGVAALILISAIWYIYSLKSDISNKDLSIAKLTAVLSLQNQEIQNAGKDRENLQILVNTIISDNKKVAVFFDNWKNEIEHRIPAKTCEEALHNVRSTSNKVANEWNTK